MEEYKICDYCIHSQYHKDGYICHKDGTYRVYKGNEAMHCSRYEEGDIYIRA